MGLLPFVAIAQPAERGARIVGLLGVTAGALHRTPFVSLKPAILEGVIFRRVEGGAKGHSDTGSVAFAMKPLNFGSAAGRCSSRK